MILRFRTIDHENNIRCLNINTTAETWNTKDEQDRDYTRYIDVSPDGIKAIYLECDFNCYWYTDDIKANRKEIAKKWGIE